MSHFPQSPQSGNWWKKILRCFSWSYSTFPAHRNVRGSKVSGTVTQSMFLLGLCTSMWKRTIPCVLTGRQHAVIVSRLLANALKSSWRRSVIAVVEVLSLGKRNAVSHAPLSGSCYPLESLTSDCSLAIVLAEMIFENMFTTRVPVMPVPSPFVPAGAWYKRQMMKGYRGDNFNLCVYTRCDCC